MKLSLVVQNAGKATGQSIPITLAQFLIGRDPQCHLRPGSALISKRHCAVIVRNGEVFARDFDSTNGTILNDEPLKGEKPVKDGDILKIGPLTFRITIDAEKPKVATSKTPTPAHSAIAKKPTPPAPTKTAHDEDAAAMLLGLDDGFGEKDESSVPDGSTVMDMPINLPTMEQPTVKLAAPEPEPAAKKEEPKKEKDKKGDSASAAARAILERFGKRTR